MKIFYCLLCGIFCLLLTGCDDGINYAPVSEINAIEPIPATGIHRVIHGETLYEIAWRYGLDYRELARINHLTSPYILYTGKIIILREHRASRIAKINNSPIIRENAKPMRLSVLPKPSVTHQLELPPSDIHSPWVWPAQGKIINYYSAMNKGINIAGKEGSPIYASARGKVVYCGDGLKAYGNLIILKHNSLYLSAYAHNRRMLVHEGDWVMKGQKIAEMGNTGSNKIKLHFEIRRAGKPINPLSLYKQYKNLAKEKNGIIGY